MRWIKLFSCLTCLSVFIAQPNFAHDFNTVVEINKRQQNDWHTSEVEFRKLDDQLKEGLGEHFERFQRRMNEQVLAHHASNEDCVKRSSLVLDECTGKGSLTESEFMLHQTLDEFRAEFDDDQALNSFHLLVRKTFEKARSLLEDMSLLQPGEFSDNAIAKRSKMRQRYANELN